MATTWAGQHISRCEMETIEVGIRSWTRGCERSVAFRACLKITRGAAARDFGFGQGGEGGASPQRADHGSRSDIPLRGTKWWRAWEAKRPSQRRPKTKDPPPGGFSRSRPSGFVAPQSKTHKGNGLPKPCESDSPNSVMRYRAQQSRSSRLAIRPSARKQHPLEF